MLVMAAGHGRRYLGVVRCMGNQAGGVGFPVAGWPSVNW